MKKPAKKKPVKSTKTKTNKATDDAKLALARQALRRKKAQTGDDGLLSGDELVGLMLLIERANDLKEAQAKALKQKVK